MEPGVWSQGRWRFCVSVKECSKPLQAWDMALLDFSHLYYAPPAKFDLPKNTSVSSPN